MKGARLKAPKHVFISYVRQNSEVVDRLKTDLESQGARVWLDRNDIEPGARWQIAIKKAIRDGQFFLACFSKEYNERDSTYMNEELTLALMNCEQDLITQYGLFRF
jgi:hypothetical protein